MANFDWTALASALGQGAQAFSAEEPQSWQHQVGGASTQWAQSKKMAQAAEKQRAERQSMWDSLMNIARGGVTPTGTPGVSSIKMSPKGEITMSITPDEAMWQQLGFDVAGTEPPTTAAAQRQPMMESMARPRAGGAALPFALALSGESQQPIW